MIKHTRLAQPCTGSPNTSRLTAIKMISTKATASERTPATAEKARGFVENPIIMRRENINTQKYFSIYMNREKISNSRGFGKIL